MAKDNLAQRKVNYDIKQRLIKARHDRQMKEDKEQEKCESWFQIIYENGGLWQKENIETSCQKLKKTKALEVLKTQINIRVTILKTLISGPEVHISKCTVPECQDQTLIQLFF